MKYFIIGLIIWLSIAWLLPQARIWRLEQYMSYKRQHYKGDDAWVYHI